MLSSPLKRAIYSKFEHSNLSQNLQRRSILKALVDGLSNVDRVPSHRHRRKANTSLRDRQLSYALHREFVWVRFEFFRRLFDCIALVGGFNATKKLDSGVSANNTACSNPS
jgi:hypothetical protein